MNIMTSFFDIPGFNLKKRATAALSGQPILKQNPFDQLQGIGVNTNVIDDEVKKGLESKKITTFTQDQFYKKVDNAFNSGDFPELDRDQMFDEMLKSFKSKGYSINGINIDEALGVPEQEVQEEQIEIKKEDPGLLQQVATKGLEFVGDTLKTQKDIVGGAVSQVPAIASNIAGFTADVADFINPIDNIIEKVTGAEEGTTLFDLEGLADQFREDGIDTKEKIQEVLGVDPEAFATQVGEFGADIGTLFIPGGQTALATKLPHLGDKIPKIMGILNKFKNNSPKAFNVFKSGINSLKEVTKFNIVSEGELPSKGEAIIGTLAGPIIDKTAKILQGPTGQAVVKKINERFGKLATKLSPSKTTKLVLDKEIKKGSEGAFIIRQNNPDVILTGDDAVSNILEASRKTRSNLFREAEKARGTGNIDPKTTTKWIDDMIGALKDPSKAKALALDRKLTKQFDVLDNIQDQGAVIKALEKQKANILAKGERSLSQWDNLIIDRNKGLEGFFNKTSADKVDSQVSAAVGTKMKENLDDVIGKLGGEFRKLKQAYGNVRTFENNLDKVYAQILRKKDAQLGDFADTFILSNMATSIAAGDATGALKALLQKGIKEKIKSQNNPNTVLQTMFELIDKELKIAPTGIIPTIKRIVTSTAKKKTGVGTALKIGVSELGE